jgi:hypothetical protein
MQFKKTARHGVFNCDLGLPAERVHCELFSPNDWLLS